MGKVKAALVATIVVTLLVGLVYIFSPAASQARAEGALAQFSQTNKLPSGSCVSDSDGDGYASCSILAQNQQSISLQCNSSLMSVVPLFGSRSCKVQDNGVMKLR